MFVRKCNIEDLRLEMVSCNYRISFFRLSWVKCMECICIIIIFK